MSKKRILIVDDEVGLTRLLKLVLTNYEIREENDPLNALATAREFNPDLILLDLIMPELDGATLAARFGEDPNLHLIPIVFLTAILSTTDANKREFIDGRPCLAKPVTKDKLVECINKHLLA